MVEDKQPETETVPVTVSLNPRVHAFLDTVSRLEGLEGIGDLLNCLALQELDFLVTGGGGRDVIDDLATRMHVDDIEIPNNKSEYIEMKAKASSKTEPTTTGSVKIHLEGENDDVVTLTGPARRSFYEAMAVTGLDADKTAELALTELLSKHKQKA